MHVTEGVGGRVAGPDPGFREPAVGGQAAVVGDGGGEEVDYVGVQAVLGPVAGEVEGGVAGSVLGELVAPEGRIGLALGNPVSIE